MTQLCMTRPGTKKGQARKTAPNLERQGQTWTDIDTQEWTGTYKYIQGQRQRQTDRDRQGQTGTDRDRQRQEGTDRDGQRHTGTRKDTLAGGKQGQIKQGLNRDNQEHFKKRRDETGTSQ